MSQSVNPIPKLLEAADAATKILSLQANIFLLKQELRTVKQLKKVTWIVAGLIILNLLLMLTFYWIEMGLYERGWSAFSLALLTFIILGILSAGSLIIAFRTSQETK